MMSRISTLPALSALALSLILSACDVAPGGSYDPAHDYYSVANTDAFITDHLILDLAVDFDQRELHGTATLRMLNLSPLAREVVLDTRDLTIDSATVMIPGEAPRPASFALGERDDVLGQPLTVTLPEDFDPQGGFDLTLAYRTAPEATALQWLPASLTTGGEHPMMFSQSQAIHARSWVPLQDTPSVRFTYEATIRTPDDMLALMSANNDPAAPRTGVYRFEMPQPIPSYLLAIAVGNLFFEPIGEDTGVYTEPELLEASAYEFAGTQDMLDLAERRFGPYEWGRYDLLILPPSFPFGGMENPRLSFITPSVLAGDRSLVSLIAHELAHSWSGNLVTNATWRDIWLNEGTTSYLEARLMEELYGVDRANEERVLSYNSLLADLDTVPARFQPLAPKVLPEDGESPQEGLQYAKGQFFLEHMEKQFGREVFDSFMADYFATFAWQSITTETFLDFLDRKLLSSRPGIYRREQAAEWLYDPGMPADFVPPVSPALENAATAAIGVAGGEVSLAELDPQAWSPQATVNFINSLPQDMSDEALEAIDAHFGFSASRNAEIARAWFIQVAERRHLPAYPAMKDHLSRHGRTRLIKPVYAALVANGQDRDLALTLFEERRSAYHPLTTGEINTLFEQ